MYELEEIPLYVQHCRPRPNQHTATGHNQCCVNVFTAAILTKAPIVIKKIKGSMDLVEVKSAWSPTSSNLLFFVKPDVTMIVLEPYIYHVLLPMKEPVPLVLLTIVDTNHIKMGGGWSFVSELQLHPLAICSSQTENHSENVSL